MRLPFEKLGEALRTLVSCTEFFPLLEDGIKRRKPALVTDAVRCELNCMPANGSLSRAAAMTHTAVRGDLTRTIDRKSPVVLHTIFRRPLGSRISFARALQNGRNCYQKKR